MNEVTNTKLENEIEWRKTMYSELKEMRKDLNTFKINSTRLIVGLTAAFTAVASSISTYFCK